MATVEIKGMIVRMKFKNCILAILLFSFIGISSTSAQKGAEPKSSKTPFLVKANLMILDSAGQYVDNVNQSEIKLFENGVEQKVTYFSKKDPGMNLALVVDNTGSMRKKLEQEIVIGKTIIANLAATDESMLIRFVSRDKISIEQVWTPDKRLVYDALDNLYIEGGISAITDALYLSVELMLKREKEAKTKRHAIVIVTDAEDRDSYYKLNEVLKLVEDTDVQVFVIAFTDELTDKPTERNNFRKNSKTNAENFARRISAATAGIAYVFAGAYTDENLRDALKSLMIELRSQYVIGYTPNDGDSETVRKLNVTVADGPKGAKRTAIQRGNAVLPVD